MKSIKMKFILWIVACCLLLGIGAAYWVRGDSMEDKAEDIIVAYNGFGGTFKNTLVKSAIADFDTPDPSVVFKDGYYYMTVMKSGAIMVLKSRTIDFVQAQRKAVWQSPAGTMYSSNLWAPEIQLIQGNWYIYFAADDGDNANHRMYALAADTDDPLGSYTFKGQIADETNKWAIDGLAMEHDGKLYFVWSGWEGDESISQNTYIAPMSDPLTISGPRVLLGEPTLEWEQAGGPINEGQAILKKDGRVFIVYSGAGSWTPYYSLGMLALEPGADPLVAANWRKSEQPLLKMDEEAGVYGPGHNSFVASPDGSEDWIVYHATTRMTDGWNNRKARAQKVTWQEDGTPHFGAPLSLDTAIRVPAGSGVMLAEHADRSGEWLTFEDVPSGIDADAPLLIHYRNASGAVQTVDIKVNGGATKVVELTATKGERTGYAYVTAMLNKGVNAISLRSGESDVEIEAIEVVRFEAENAQAGGGSESKVNFRASGWGVMEMNGADASATFANVNVPISGTYALRFSVSNPSGKGVAFNVLANGGQAEILSAASTEPDEFVTLDIALRLNAGSNDIVLGEADGRLIVDYFDLIGVS
ncbi:family 43 glycosylhydrolase [Cohnella herbarum]|uniref:Family 43 glycosylhydrolase n=1 Tax=Cohnella herbarum TaxID=2728023 RepID=A0A7Z2VG40_9BACL|nr:family 43 glycosylhydrolase [Cohnella herbarum]QJD82548.1 family 43 glycosylhydrolase [Cohnella herbarum]